MRAAAASISPSGTAPGGPPRHRYCVYGIDVLSDSPLPMPSSAAGGASICQVALQQAPPAVFDLARERALVGAPADAWCRSAVLEDGSTYVSWNDVGEFLVAADGGTITCRRAERSSVDSFQVYLLGQAFSYALVKQRLEPLHATAVVLADGPCDQAVAFLGGNGFGKSTLAACFLSKGARLVTDDLLILQESGKGVLAYPGPPRLKLFPRMANRVLGAAAGDVAMNAETAKRILPIAEGHSCSSPVPLRALYTLAAPRDACRLSAPSIEHLGPREAFIELLRHAFNRRLVNASRMASQFTAMARLADAVPMKKLAYPRTVDVLADVRRAVLEDLRQLE